MRRYASLVSVSILMLLAMSPAVWGQFTGGSGFVNQSSSSTGITGITSDSSGVTGITFSGAGPHLEHNVTLRYAANAHVFADLNNSSKFGFTWSTPDGRLHHYQAGTFSIIGGRNAADTGADITSDTANIRTNGKIHSFRNQGTEKLSVRYDGALVGATGNLLHNTSIGYWISDGGVIAQGADQGFRISGGGMLTTSGGTTTLSADGVGNLRLHAGGTKSVMVDGKTQISDSALEPSHWNAYINEAGNALVFKVKYADGTVKTASVPLL